MSHIGYAENEYGNTVSVHVCESCKCSFTVIPPKTPEDQGWEGCMGLGCDSYDVGRDVDLMFETEPERITREETWRPRK